MKINKTTIVAAIVIHILFSTIAISATGVRLFQENNQSTAFSPEESWPMFLHDPQHTGYSPSSAPNTNNILWNYSTGFIIDSSPAIHNEKIYFSSHDGYVYCLNARTGELVWSYFTAIGYLDSSPIVYNDRVYIGSCSNLYCLNASDGSFIWSYHPIMGLVGTAPVISDDKVYIVSASHVAYDVEILSCLDTRTGDLVWDFYIDFPNDVSSGRSSPALYDGKIYMGSCDGHVYCLDAETGAMLWSYRTGYDIESSPAVINGRVYVGSMDWKMYCIDADDGSFIWSFTTGYPVRSSPVVAAGKVYFGSWDTNLYCLDENGHLVWKYATGDQVSSSPAIADGKIYIGSEDGTVYCFDIETGLLIWEYTTQARILSSPAIALGNVYIGSWDGDLYCFGVLPNPLDPPRIPSGPDSGYIAVEYTYITSLTVSDGDDIYYRFDWGNGDNSGWVGPYAPAEPGNASYAWSLPGTYAVRVKAKDQDHTESNWSEPLTVTITAAPSPHLELGVLTGGFGKVAVEIKNSGDVDATNITWTITVDGVRRNRLDVSSEGTLNLLTGGSSQEISTDKFVRGLFRKIEITVTVTADNVETATKTVDGRVFFLFVIIK